MSQLQAVRVRSQRSAVAAVERARLTVVNARPSSAPRAPFAVLVFLILGAGVVGLLMFNTQMQQASIHATQLQAKADRLQAWSQALNKEIEDRRDPQQVAAAALALGMVTPPNPAFVNLRNGRVDGTPIPATTEDRTRIRPNLTRLPSPLDPSPIVHKVFATPAATGQTTGGSGVASPPSGTATGSNKTQHTPAQGAPR